MYRSTSGAFHQHFTFPTLPHNNLARVTLCDVPSLVFVLHLSERILVDSAAPIQPEGGHSLLQCGIVILTRSSAVINQNELVRSDGHMGPGKRSVPCGSASWLSQEALKLLSCLKWDQRVSTMQPLSDFEVIFGARIPISRTTSSGVYFRTGQCSGQTMEMCASSSDVVLF